MKTQVEVFEDSARKWPGRTALEYFGRSVTYGEMVGIVDAMAARLSPAVGRGDVVALSLQNVPQFVLLEYAVWKLGGTVLPLNPMYTPREIAYYLRDAKAKAAVALCETLENVESACREVGGVAVFRTSAESFAKVPEANAAAWGIKGCDDDLAAVRGGPPPAETVGPDDVALLVYTSGTTGDPKGAVIRHRNVYASSTVYRDWFRFTPEDRALAIAPFFHVTGLVFHIATPILCGSSVCMTYRFDPELAVGTAERCATTVTMAASTAYLAMLNVPGLARLTGMRLWSSGGMAVPRSLEERWREVTGRWIYVAWGLTETTSPATLWPYPYDGGLPLDRETGVVSAGLPVYGTRVKLVDQDDPARESAEVGEIAVKGPQVVDGYLNREEATARTIVDGWLLTGDVARLVDGQVYIIDRKKDLINASGYKVWPREVEEVIYGHPAVSEAVVVGVPDPYRGETIKAYVKLRAGYPPTDETRASIVSHARKGLAAFKVPRAVEFTDDVKKTASGKIMRRAFREAGGE